MYYDKKTGKYYDSEFDLCFEGHEKELPKVKINSFDDLLDIKVEDNLGGKENGCKKI